MKLGGQRRLAIVFACAAVASACDDDAPVQEEQRGDDAAVFAACPDSLPEFAVGLAGVGENGRIQARLLDASRFPPHKYANEWTLELANADGEPLADAQITRLAAFMPIHGHYGRPAAKSEALDEPGQMRAQIHFTMRGPWEVQIWASSAAAGDDYLRFEVCVVE